MKIKFLLLLCFISHIAYGQGLNHQWLLGSFNLLQNPKGRILFDSNNYSLIGEFRKMPFKGTQGNISDSLGNLLMASNGNWIANATGDTMLNGSNINPGTYASSWPFGFPIPSLNIFIPFPGDYSKFVLFHQTSTDPNFTPPSNELFYSTIDITLDNGLGEVINKNNIVYSDSLSYGISACKHANGKDWWIVTMHDSSDVIKISLLTDSGITLLNNQTLGFSPFPSSNVSQLTFSQNGDKFISNTYDNPNDKNSFIVLSDFNRCSGVFSNTQTIYITSGDYIIGLAFSPSGKYAYASTSNFIFQIDTDTYNVDTVAIYDGFISPGPVCCATSFWSLYLAANGKIYSTSGSSVQHIHEMNYPDSAGIACDVQQHSIDLVDYVTLRAVPNHPNYYLGCDTTLGCPCLTTLLEEIDDLDFNFSISPNPSVGQLKLIYLLPQNNDGLLEIFDIKGNRIFRTVLPRWSTLQYVDLSHLVSDGLYNCVLTSNGKRVSKKIIVLKD